VADAPAERTRQILDAAELRARQPRS